MSVYCGIQQFGKSVKKTLTLLFLLKKEKEKERNITTNYLEFKFNLFTR